MNVFAWILGAVLTVVFVAAGVSKLIDLDRARDRFGYSRRQYQLIGLSEVAGAAAIIVGLIWRQLEWIAIAAGIGICSLMLGALMAHAGANDDAKTTLPAGILFLATIVFLIVISLR